LALGAADIEEVEVEEENEDREGLSEEALDMIKCLRHLKILLNTEKNNDVSSCQVHIKLSIGEYKLVNFNSKRKPRTIDKSVFE
jgi:hypothetical protein